MALSLFKEFSYCLTWNHCYFSWSLKIVLAVLLSVPYEPGMLHERIYIWILAVVYVIRAVDNHYWDSPASLLMKHQIWLLIIPFAGCHWHVFSDNLESTNTGTNNDTIAGFLIEVFILSYNPLPCYSSGHFMLLS